MRKKIMKNQCIIYTISNQLLRKDTDKLENEMTIFSNNKEIVLK